MAIEVRYHRKCDTKYTNFLHKQDKKAGDGAKSLYDAGYEQRSGRGTYQELEGNIYVPRARVAVWFEAWLEQPWLSRQ